MNLTRLAGLALLPVFLLSPVSSSRAAPKVQSASPTPKETTVPQPTLPSTTVAPTPHAKVTIPKVITPKVTTEMVQKMVNRVLKETSEVRHLAIKHPVKGSAKSRAEVEQMIKEEGSDEAPTQPAQAPAEQPSADEPDADDIRLRQLGIVPDTFQSAPSQAKVEGEQIAGAYDTDTKTFYTADSVTPAELETVMAHELTHALQDQWFDLNHLQDLPDNESDASLAVAALVEGDATFTMLQYAKHNPKRLQQIKAEPEVEESDPEFDSSPHYIQEYLLFPYLKGLSFVTQLHTKGGWPGLNAAYHHVPQSTEQILHIDKYLAHEAPVAVKLHDVTPQLGMGWTLLYHDVDGELGLSLILSQYIKDPATVERAVAGWGGDRYSVYNGPKNAAIVVQDTVWDSETDAREWYQAYTLRSTNRFKVKAQHEGALQVWSAPSHGIWMEQQGKRVIVVEGTVGSFNPDLVLSTLLAAS